MTHLSENKSNMLSTNTQNIKMYTMLLKIRPTQLGVFAKQLLRVKRQFVCTKRGQKFLVDPVSVFGLELLCQGVYEPQMSRFLELVLRANDVFVDVGGNEGYFSVLASSLIQNGTVHCIEPQSRLQRIIQENISLNSVNSIVVHPVAISNQEGEVNLFLRPSTNTGASSFFRHWKLGSTYEKVPTTKLDAFFQRNSLERVRLLKIDCEGAEYLVIAGGNNILKKHQIDFIAMEYHESICGWEKCAEIHKLLQTYGYILTKCHGQCIYHLPGLEQELQLLGRLQINCDWHE